MGPKLSLHINLQCLCGFPNPRKEFCFFFLKKKKNTSLMNPRVFFLSATHAYLSRIVKLLTWEPFFLNTRKTVSYLESKDGAGSTVQQEEKNKSTKKSIKITTEQMLNVMFKLHRSLSILFHFNINWKKTFWNQFCYKLLIGQNGE